MRQFRFDYSLKNIPIPSQDAYLRNLIEKMENVLKRMRWKAHFFLKGDKISDQNNLSDFLPTKHLPPFLELKSFDYIDIVLFHLTLLISTHRFQKTYWTKHYLGPLIWQL